MTPLYIASENGQLAVVKAILKAGADVDQAGVCSATPRYYIASMNGQLAVVEAHMKAGAAVDQADTRNVTPLYIAA